jgi:hypothetical protein
MKKVLLLIINSLIINSIQSEEMKFITNNILTEKSYNKHNNSFLSHLQLYKTSTYNVMKKNNFFLVKVKDSLDYFSLLFYQLILEILIAFIIFPFFLMEILLEKLYTQFEMVIEQI